MITQRIIQAMFDKANASGSDVMRWSDFLDCLEELKHTDTTAYTEDPVAFADLDVYDDESAADTGGLTGGTLYRTTTGEIRVKLPET
jgi:hypothetical protein